MNANDNDLGQALVDIEDLTAATRALRSDLNDLRAESRVIAVEAKAARDHLVDALRQHYRSALDEHRKLTDDKFRQVLAERDATRRN